MKKGLILILGLMLVCIATVTFAENSKSIIEESQDQASWGVYKSETTELEYDVPEPKVSNSEPGLALQGGDNFNDAFVITSLPFHDTGSTVSYANDWTPPCCPECMNGPDVVYSYTPTSDIVVNVNTCGATWYDVLYIFENDENTSIGCNLMETSVCPPRSVIDGVQLYAGNTYYFVEDGYMELSGEYGIHITPVISLDCPPEATLEGEPDCGYGYVDTYNGGCSVPTHASTPINLGDVICGSSGVYVRNDSTFRDADWYRIELTEPTLLTWSAVAEFPPQIFIIDGAGDDCDLAKITNDKQSVMGDTVSIQHNAVPGVYYFFVSTASYNGYDCPLTYIAWLDGEEPPAPPANDNCEDVAIEHLTPTDTLIIDGNNIGATTQCRELELIPEVWAAFDIVAQSDVYLGYCGTDPVFDGAYIVFVDECPCDSLVFCYSYTHGDCGDQNFSAIWHDLPAGTYYYPIMSKPGRAYGDYHITIASTSIHPGVVFDQDEISYGVASGRTGSMTWTISNPGYGMLYFSLLAEENNPGTDWLNIDVEGDSIGVGGEDVVVNVSFDATSLAEGEYTGYILFNSNSPDYNEVYIPVTLTVGPAGFAYMPGDANMATGTWPPAVVGGDVTYLVNYFRGMVPACKIDDFFASADVNGNCAVNGSDVTYLVNYFRGMNEKNYCSDYVPLWESSGDLPSEAPSNWPPCDQE